MASLFGKPSAGGASEDEPLDDFDDDADDGGDLGMLAVELEPAGPPEHIRVIGQDLFGDDDAKISALYEFIKATQAESDMPEEDTGGLPPLPDEELPV